MRLQAKRFEFEKSANREPMNLAEGEHFGFLAQELEQVFPQLVVEAVHPGFDQEKSDVQSESIRYKAVKMMELIPVLVQAIQEQQRTIENLQAQVAQLMSE